MASARRIGLWTAVKIARRIDGSNAVKQWSINNKCPSIHCNKYRDLSTAVKRWRGTPKWPSYNLRCFENRFIRHDVDEAGYTVDVADLLFTPERDFLVKNNGQKVKIDDLRGKTIVLFIVPLDKFFVIGSDMHVTRPGAGDTWDMIDAYNELLRVGSNVEFVFVPVRLRNTVSRYDRLLPQEPLFQQLFSAMPFPAIPFSDVQGPESPLVQTFSVDAVDRYDPFDGVNRLPYWVVIDPTNTVVTTRIFHHSLFKLFGGAELHPLSRERIEDLYASEESQSPLQYISKWDQLLASDTRDFLLSSNGDKVPISSLKGKLVGLYFCENIPHPPRMQAIKKVYEEAKSRGYDFEIVQITFHYHPFNAIYRGTNPNVQHCCEDVSWLTLPFKDPSCRKLQRVLHCAEKKDFDDNDPEYWVGDSLVLIHPGQAEADHRSGVLFEFSGAEILKCWGIEGYPFTRQSLYKGEYELQKREVTLRSLFPPGERLLRSVGDGFNLVDAFSELSGKRVLVLLAHFGYQSPLCKHVGDFISMLKSEYEAQVDGNVEEDSKFEVVYVSIGGNESSFKEFTKDMPWLVRPFSSHADWGLLPKIFKGKVGFSCAAAFNEQGELIAKVPYLSEKKEGDKLRFPFIDRDLEKSIVEEVEDMCNVAN